MIEESAPANATKPTPDKTGLPFLSGYFLRFRGVSLAGAAAWLRDHDDDGRLRDGTGGLRVDERNVLLGAH